MVVKWSACLPSTPMIRVRILLKPAVFSVKFVFEKKKNKQNEAGVGPFLNKRSTSAYIYRSSFILERRKLDPNFTLNGKSKSLDDLLPVSDKKSKNISLLELGRSNTYDDQVKTN